MTVATETDEPGADATARSARLRHLIITVYGLYARHDGGWLSVATLIRLLADLGIDEPAVRSAISRLKRRGILQARRHDGAAGYQLSAEALAILREGDARIFRRGRATPADGWVLAVFSVPESERHRRHVLRSELTRLGFGMAHGFSAVKEMYLDRFADVFAAAGLNVLVFDNRCFGASDGEPRQEIDPWAQVRDYRHAITYLHTLPEVDPARIGIWGSSYSGGHVLVVAAIDRRVKAVVSQVPLISGHANLRALVRADFIAGFRELFDADRLARFQGKAPGMSLPPGSGQRPAVGLVARRVGRGRRPPTARIAGPGVPGHR